MCDVYEGTDFSRENVYKWVNIGFLLLAKIGVETQSLSSKEKVPVTALNKEGDADSLQRHERIHHYWSLWKSWNCKQCFLLLAS